MVISFQNFKVKVLNSFILLSVVMPHLGSATVKSRNAMAKLAADNILRAVSGEEMLTPVEL